MVDNKRRDTDGDGETSAADEPTAIWDFEALRAAGLDAILHQPESEPPRRPATAPPGSSEPSMMVESDLLHESQGSGESGRDTPNDLKAVDPVAVIESIAPVEMRPGFEGAPTRRYGWGAALAAGALFFGAVYALICFLM